MNAWEQRAWAIKRLLRWRRDYGVWFWAAFWDAFIPRRHSGKAHMVPVCPVCDTRHAPDCRERLAHSRSATP